MDTFNSLLKAPFDIEQEYTFYQDFQIAEKIGGEKAVKRTYENAKSTWTDNPKAWGEVTCALNWRLWDLYETDEKLAKLYEKLWEESTDVGYKKGGKNKEYMDIFHGIID